jgi:hypothetical protein
MTPGRAVTIRHLSVALVAVAAIVCGGEVNAPEERVRELVALGIQAAEEGDLRELMELVSEDYHDSRGNDRRSLRGLLTLYLRQGQTVVLFRRITEIELTGSAEARVVLLLAAGARPVDGTLDPREIDADLLRVDLSAVEEGGEWKVTSADWERAEPGDLF